MIIKVFDQQTQEDFEDDIYLTAVEVDERYEDIIVSTTKKVIEDCLKEIESSSKEDKLFFLYKSRKCAREVDIDEIYNDGGQKWRNFCDDVLIYYCLRFILFDMHFPIIRLSQEDKDMAKKLIR